MLFRPKRFEVLSVRGFYFFRIKDELFYLLSLRRAGASAAMRVFIELRGLKGDLVDSF